MSIQEKLNKAKAETTIAIAYADNVRFQRTAKSYAFTRSELKELLETVAREQDQHTLHSLDRQGKPDKNRGLVTDNLKF